MVKKKILIVDDEEDLVALISRRLVAAGYEVFSAGTGEAALEMVSNIYPDLIILDIMMPGMNGFEVKERLNKSPSTAGIPLLFLTARGEQSDKVQGFKLGIDDYVVKPFEPPELLARIESILKRRDYYEEISMTDGLTGLYNVHFFRKQMKMFIAIAKRYKQVFALAVVDIDGLKKINDTYGHASGDAVLQNFADVAKSVLRETDVVIRYGGDEFAIILPNVNRSQARVSMDRLSARVKDTSVCDASGARIPFSISFGISDYNEDIKYGTQMFEAADAEMYEYKKSKSHTAK